MTYGKTETAKPVVTDVAGDVAMVSARVLEKLREDPTVQFPSSDSVVIAPGDLSRIKAESKILSLDEKLARRRARNHRKEAIRTTAGRRRADMKRVDEANRVKGVAALSAAERAERTAKAGALTEAQKKMDEGLDAVKKMNSMSLYAKVQAVRDQQLADKIAAAAKEAEEDRRLDDIMEADRLAAIQASVDKEAKASKDRYEGAAMIKVQMARKEKLRERERELMYQEGQEMLQRIAKLEADDAVEQERREQEAAALLQQIKVCNEAASRAKEMDRERARQEDEAIAQYVADKAAREQAAEERKEREKAEKDRLAKLMIRQQTKVLDNRSELDELRAKRAQEEVDRKWRAECLAKAQRNAKMKAELEEARVLAVAEKERMVQDIFEQEKLEYEHMVEDFNLAIAENEAKQARDAAAKQAYNKALLAQIREHETAGVEEDKAEIKRSKEALKAEAAKLERIKQEKLASLRKAGVPEKYLGELSRFQVKSE